MISVVRAWHNAASSVSRTSRGDAMRSDGYSRAARSRQEITSFSVHPSNRPFGSPNALARSTLTTSRRKVSVPSTPGSDFNSYRNRSPPPMAAAGSPSLPPISSSSRATTPSAASNLSSVTPQNRSSNCRTALLTSRESRPDVGGSSRCARHRAITASRNHSRRDSVGHSSADSQLASSTWSASEHSRNPSSART